MGGLLLRGLGEVTQGDPRSRGDTRVDAGISTGTEGTGGENGMLLFDMWRCLILQF